MGNPGGPITLLGSGETALAGGRIFETIAARIRPPLRIAVLETPAGFELNSSQVAGRVSDFLLSRLRNFSPQVDTIPARKRGSSFSPDDAAIVAPLASANMIFMGPGSPTYAIRQLKGSLAWDLLRGRQRLGAALVFASAAAIAVGRWCLPVYEIYKAGEDVYTCPGLDLFSDFGLRLSVIPHWNNSDGGEDVDTSRCFIGSHRFEEWHKLLPPDEVVLGLDEHTGFSFDFSARTGSVQGSGTVSIIRTGELKIFPAGAKVPLAAFGELKMPASLHQGISHSTWTMIESTCTETGETPSQEVMKLLDERSKARRRRDWAASDRIREKISELGWQVQDSPANQVLLNQRGSKKDSKRS